MQCLLEGGGYSGLSEESAVLFRGFFLCLFDLFILFLMLPITEQILFTIKINNKMQIDFSTLVKKTIEHKKCYIKNTKDKIS